MSSPRALGMAHRLLRGLLRPNELSTLVLLVTDRCDARCPFCFHTKLRRQASGEGDAAGAPPLTPDEYARITGHLRPLYQVILGGGEPFLRRDLEEIADAVCDAGAPALVSIPTNGGRPKRTLATVTALAARHPAQTFNVIVSLDAVGEQHDALRGVPGLFRRAAGLAEALAELGRRRPNLHLVIGTVVAEETIDGVPALIEELQRRLGPTLPRFHNLQYDQRLGAALNRDGALRAKVDALERRAPPSSDLVTRVIERVYVRALNRLLLDQTRAGRMLYRCNAGRKIAVVLSDGEVAPCEPFVFEPEHADARRLSLRDFDYDYRRLAADPRYRALQRFIDEDRCEVCAWSCAAISSAMFRPSNWPRLLLR